MPEPVNDRILDREIRHLVGLQRLAGGEVREILAILDATEEDLRGILTDRLSRIDFSTTETQRLANLLSEVRAMRTAAHRAMGTQLSSDLIEIGEYEIDFQRRLIQNAAPVTLDIGTLSAVSQVAEIVRSKPFNGLILSDWVADLADKDVRRIQQAINIGMVEGQGVEDIVNRVVGSRSGHVKGVIDMSRHHATTWVRSAVSHTANEARDALYAANTDVIKGVTFTATLDNRTTSLCIARDGFTYSLPDHEPLDGGPPWLSGPGRLHPRCRSSGTPVLKSWRELGIDLSEAPEGTRASMNGQVPQKTTYREWIKRQNASVQNEVLGVKRAKALRRGDLSVAEMFDDRGEFWTLDELRRREGVAFG